MRPIPRFALSFSYAGAALMLLGWLWYALALWRSSQSAKAFWKIAVRAVAVLLVLYVAVAPFYLIPTLQHYFGSPPPSVMDSGAGK
jgi:hypothetical protein